MGTLVLMTDDTPTLEQTMAAQARLRKAAEARNGTSDPSKGAGGVTGCFTALGVAVLSAGVLGGFVGGWLYLFTILF